MSYTSTAFFQKKIVLLLAALILSISVPFAIGGKSALEHLAAIHISTAAPLIILFLTKWLLNVIRCQILLKANGIHFQPRDTMLMIWAYDAAAESTPGGIGGPIAGWALLKKENVPTSVAAGMGLFLLAGDIVSITCLLCWALLSTTPLAQSDTHWKIVTALIILAIVLISAGSLIRYRHRLIRTLRKHAPKRIQLEKRLRKPMKAWLRIGRTVERITALSVTRLTAFALASLGHWTCRLSVIYFTIAAIGLHVPWIQTLLIQIVGGMIGAMVSLPGGFVGADMAITILLAPSLDIKTIATVIFLWRLLTFHMTLALGGLSYLYLSYKIFRPKRISE